MQGTVTVKKAPRKRFTLEFSALPDQSFGPYGFAEAISQVGFAALLSPIDARNLVMDAAVDGAATAETG